jgi:hypothetical protein
MGIEVVEGRDFRQGDENTEQGAWIFNETAQKQLNLELNTSIDGGGEIVGFMPDIKIASFRMAVEPMAFAVFGTANSGWDFGRYVYIKLKAGTNLRAAVSHIQTTLADYNSDYPFEVRFYDEVLQQLYEKETSLSSLISLFSIIAIFISIVGVFGLVVFDSECRRKEIGIRPSPGDDQINSPVFLFSATTLFSVPPGVINSFSFTIKGDSLLPQGVFLPSNSVKISLDQTSSSVSSLRQNNFPKAL